jgi:predicted nucleic acid-binding protein
MGYPNDRIERDRSAGSSHFRDGQCDTKARAHWSDQSRSISQAHADLLDLAIELWPYDLLATRAWELRLKLSIYDATYIALAEITDLTLVTLDKRLAKAPGTRCPIATP